MIRKLQARDCDLSLCNAELRRVHAELRAAYDRLGESKQALEAAEADKRKQAADWRNHVQQLEAELEAEIERGRRLEGEVKEAEQEALASESELKKELDRVQMELNNTQERLHVQVGGAYINYDIKAACAGGLGWGLHKLRH